MAPIPPNVKNQEKSYDSVEPSELEWVAKTAQLRCVLRSFIITVIFTSNLQLQKFSRLRYADHQRMQA